MGAWGVNLYQDDVTLDIKEGYKDKLHRGKKNDEATQEIIDESQDLIEDEEDKALFWFALADTQWNLGRLDEYVKNEALKYIKLGIDLERWKDNTQLYKKRKVVLEKLKEKLLSPQPEEKKISKYRGYKCGWKIGDVFAYQLKREYAKEKGLEGRYLILQKVSERRWWPDHIIPIMRVKITENTAIPKNENEINNLEYIQTDSCQYERRFWGAETSKILEIQRCDIDFKTDEYGLLPEYMVSIIITSKNKFLKELIYLGNYPNISSPKNEFIPFHELNIPTIKWQEIEEETIEMYLGHNKRNYSIYKKT